MTDLDAIRRRAEAATRPVPGYAGYEADGYGRIWSVASDWRGYGRRVLVPDPNASGYLSVRVCRDGKRVRRPVHTLVALAFHGLPQQGMQVRHLDGDKMNNCPSNLGWGTAKENALDRMVHGRTPCGDKNGSRLHPERLARGERNGTHTHPERRARGTRQGSAKVNESAVIEIRRLSEAGQTYTNIGRLFGIHRKTVRLIVNRSRWAHVG